MTSECLYYIWPPLIGSTAYPRYGRSLDSTGDVEPYWNEFHDTLSSVYTSLKGGFHNFFYVAHCHYTIFIFRIDGADTEESFNQTNMTSMPGSHFRAIIAPVSKGLRYGIVISDELRIA